MDAIDGMVARFFEQSMFSFVVVIIVVVVVDQVAYLPLLYFLCG